MPNTLSNLIGNADVFPILNKWHFFNHAGVCPLPRPVSDAIRKFADQAQDNAYLDFSWHKDVATLRRQSADLINASKEEIAFIKNTSEGIATVAKGIDWVPGDRIITTGVEYPANIYPWMDVAKRHDVQLIMIPEQTNPDGSRSVPLEHILREAAHSETRLIALSHVEFASGQRHDIAAIGKFCRENDVLFSVDAIQSLGVLPVDVQAMNVDYLSADGHKWLLSTEGAGIFYCRKELLPKTRPLAIGWLNVINPEKFCDYDFTLKDDATKFESGSLTVVNLLALKAAIELLTDVGIQTVANRMKSLTDHLIQSLAQKGYTIISPRENNAWSAIVSFHSPNHDLAAIVTDLRKNHQTEIAFREGRLRVSAHFYNTEAQIDRLVQLLPQA